MGAAVTAFRRLIEEEQKHIAFIERMLQNLRNDEPMDTGAAADAAPAATSFFDERAKSEFLEQCVEGSMIPDVTVFNTAWLIEKDLSEFYASMAEKTDGDAKEAFQMLANWEKEHERFFREYRDKLSEMYANMPWGG